MSDIYEVVDVVQGSKEWLEWRKTGVTATCSPILLEEAGATKRPTNSICNTLAWLRQKTFLSLNRLMLVKAWSTLPEVTAKRDWTNRPAFLCKEQKVSLHDCFAGWAVRRWFNLEIKNLCESKHLSILQLKPNRQNSVITTGKFSTSCWQQAHQAYLVFWSATDQTKVFKIMPSKKAFYRVRVACEYFWNKVQTKTALPFDKEKDILLISDPEIMSQTQGF